LLENGADFNIRDVQKSPIIHAMLESNIQIFESFLQYGYDPIFKFDNGKTVIDYIVNLSSNDKIRSLFNILINYDVDIYTKLPSL
jgi:ankyrin repeat protein